MLTAISPMEQYEALGAPARDPHPEPGGCLLALQGRAAEEMDLVAGGRKGKQRDGFFAYRMEHYVVSGMVCVGNMWADRHDPRCRDI